MFVFFYSVDSIPPRSSLVSYAANTQRSWCQTSLSLLPTLTDLVLPALIFWSHNLVFGLPLHCQRPPALRIAYCQHSFRHSSDNAFFPASFTPFFLFFPLSFHSGFCSLLPTLLLPHSPLPKPSYTTFLLPPPINNIRTAPIDNNRYFPLSLPTLTVPINNSYYPRSLPKLLLLPLITNTSTVLIRLTRTLAVPSH